MLEGRADVEEKLHASTYIYIFLGWYNAPHLFLMQKKMGSLLYFVRNKPS